MFPTRALLSRAIWKGDDHPLLKMTVPQYTNVSARKQDRSSFPSPSKTCRAWSRGRSHWRSKPRLDRALLFPRSSDSGFRFIMERITLSSRSRRRWSGTSLGSLRPHGRGSITRCRRINKRCGGGSGGRIGGSSKYIRGGSVYSTLFYSQSPFPGLSADWRALYIYEPCASSGMMHI